MDTTAKITIIVAAGIILAMLIYRFIRITIIYKKRKRDIELEIQRAPTHVEREYWKKKLKHLWKIYIYG